MKSDRGQNHNKYILKNLHQYDHNKVIPNQIEAPQTMRQNSKINKILLSSANSFIKTKSNTKNKKTYGNLLMKNKPNFAKIIKQNIQKYNSDTNFFYIKVINDIIYDEKKHTVCMFQDYLLWDENVEFLKRNYIFSESNERIPKISAYYEKYTVIKPIYFKLTCNKIMTKYIKKKKKYFELLEENEDKAGKEAEELDHTQYSELLKSSLMKDTTNKNQEAYVTNVKKYRDFETIERDMIKKKLKYQEDAAEDQVYRINLYQSMPEITDINPDETNNLSFVENMDRIIGSDEEELQPNKNKEMLKIQDLISTAKEHLQKRLEINSRSAEKKQSVSPNNLKGFRISPDKMNILQCQTAREDKQPKIVKKIEIKKLNLENINKLALEQESKYKSSSSRNKLNTISKHEMKTKERNINTNLTERAKNPPTNIILNSIYTSRINQAKIPTLESNILTKRTHKEIASKFNMIKKMLKQINLNNKENSNNKFSNIELKTKDVKESSEIKTLDLDKSKIKNKISLGNNPQINNFYLSRKNENYLTKKITQTSKSKSNSKTPTKIKESNDKSKKNLNTLIKSSTLMAKNMLKDNSSSLVNKYLSNNYCHLKATSQTNFSKDKTNNKLNTNPSSVYNINLNLNLNLNVKMEKKKSNSNAENISKINNGEWTDRQNAALTDRQSVNYNNTINSNISKIDKLLERKINVKLSSAKSQEKHQKLSRNLNVKNFILNYDSVSNGNFLFKKQNPMMVSNKLNEFPLMSDQNSYSNRVSNFRDLLNKNNSNNNSTCSNNKIGLNFNSNRISKEILPNDSKNYKKADVTNNFQSGVIVNQKHKNYALFNNQKSNAYSLKNENIGPLSRQALTSRNEKEKGLIKIFK